ncbi:type IIL restriction-modification enzyme MmeI [uncultured Cardiobacterium sp.]|uniref:class I SAM-dependent DNA methyltransferase n=1 Tax=uncultured Cardiobacterium sp. TaxID=417619 RepID=UPI0034541601
MTGGREAPSAEQKADLQTTFAHRCKNWKSLDYVAGWFIKAADYMQQDENSAAAFVATNSICQGQQVPILWPLLFANGLHITFAHTSFKWANLASHNAGVTVAIIGISRRNGSPRRLYSHDEQGKPVVKEAANINAYLVPGANIIIEKASSPISEQSAMDFGNKPVDGGNLLMSRSDMQALQLTAAEQARYIRRIYGSAEYIRGINRYCLWLSDADLPQAEQHTAIAQRIAAVRAMRLASSKAQTVEIAAIPHRFGEVRQSGNERSIVVPRVSSENRDYLPVGYLENAIIADAAFALYDAPLWSMALIASRLHLVWIATVCGKLETRYRYSNTLGWNTFPVPPLTEQHKADLTESAAAILLARETHFPKTIADLYAPGAMPENLRHAHERNDEILERIYIGRRFKNDTERLEKLFALYSEMTTQKNVAKSKKTRKKKP